MRRVLLGVALSAAGISSLAVLAQEVKPASFEVTLIKAAKPDERGGRGWHSARNITNVENYPLMDLILRAYDLKSPMQILNVPEWAKKDHYDITAKSSEQEFERLAKLKAEESGDEYRVMVQSMLAERFGLLVEKSTQRMPRFTIKRASDGVIEQGLKPTPVGPDGRPPGGRNVSSNGSSTLVTMEVSGASMEDIAKILSGRAEVGHRVVIDTTGVPGFFSFRLQFAPDNGMGISPDATVPGLLDVVRQELGLKLVKDEGDVPVVIVKAAKKPELD